LIETNEVTTAPRRHAEEKEVMGEGISESEMEEVV